MRRRETRRGFGLSEGRRERKRGNERTRHNIRIPLVITSTSIAFRPFSNGSRLRFCHMCMTNRTLKRKQNHEMEAVISAR